MELNLPDPLNKSQLQFSVVTPEFLLQGKNDLLYAVLISRNVTGSVPSMNSLFTSASTPCPQQQGGKKGKKFIKEKPKAVQLLF